MNFIPPTRSKKWKILSTNAFFLKIGLCYHGAKRRHSHHKGSPAVESSSACVTLEICLVSWSQLRTFTGLIVNNPLCARFSMFWSKQLRVFAPLTGASSSLVAWKGLCQSWGVTLQTGCCWSGFRWTQVVPCRRRSSVSAPLINSRGCWLTDGTSGVLLVGPINVPESVFVLLSELNYSISVFGRSCLDS